MTEALVKGEEELLAFERDKIKGAVRTDFILSAEIIAITLGAVAGTPLSTQASVLTLVALLMTVGVYGLVAGIVKLDDAGLLLSKRPSKVAQRLGALLLVAAPWLMRTLAVVGTAAMFLVGGGILVHGVPALHHAIEALSAGMPAIGWLIGLLGDALVGIVAGFVVVGVVMGIGSLRRRVSDKS